MEKGKSTINEGCVWYSNSIATEIFAVACNKPVLFCILDENQSGVNKLYFGFQGNPDLRGISGPDQIAQIRGVLNNK